ncbi:MAG TPA: ABC transporter permease [Candidatus Saccharimonadales bacterium]|nr:ABC transporter permease [Candidatus Saccharimonadales bacterium]
MVGIVIGVMSVITIVAIGQGIKQQIGGQIHSLGANIITVRTAQLKAGSNPGAFGDLTGFSVTAPLTQKDINTVEKAPAVSAVAPLTLVTGSASGDNGIYKPAFVIGTSPDLPSLLNQSIAYGSFFTGSDVAGNVAVIGQNVANAMFNANVPLGRTLYFHGQSFIVQGIFNQFTTDPLSQQADLNNAIFIPEDVAQSLTNNTAPTYEIFARADSVADTKLAADNIRNSLIYSHGGAGGFAVTTANQNLGSSNGILDLMTNLIAGVAAISLLVAGIGIMNVMLVSVSERVREIGIRKAVGATNRQILAQFMIESGFLSLSGGLIGIALSYAIVYSIRALTDLKPVISVEIVVIAAGVSLLVGLIFGTIPAVKASRKDPIEALRAE